MIKLQESKYMNSFVFTSRYNYSFIILFYFSTGTDFQFVLTVGSATISRTFHMEIAIVGIAPVVNNTMDFSQ